jgi:hypothetical protein
LEQWTSDLSPLRNPEIIWNNKKEKAIPGNSNNEEELLIHSLLQQHPNNNATTASNDYDDALTLICQKVFCYTTEEGSLLQEIRVRPNSPRKKIPLDQAVSLYETATTYISSRDDDTNTDNNSDFIVHSEGPSGQSLWGKASVKKMDDERLEWTVYTKRRSKKSPLYLPDLTTPTKPTTTRKSTDSTTIVVSPERSALIQFGASNMEESKHRFGARETCSWTIPKPAAAAVVVRKQQWWKRQAPPPSSPPQDPPHLQYTRYGEGPPFYAPNRMCMLELQATPIDSVQQASPAVRQLVNQNKLQGWGCYTINNSDDDKSSLSSFRESKLRLILPEPETWTQRKRQQAITLWGRVRGATSLQPMALLE